MHGMTMKKTIYIGLVGLIMAGCSQAAPQMTVEVSGAPGQVSECVIAEKARNADVDVTHSDGNGTAVFAVTDSNDGYAISRRAIQARLSVETNADV